jgi:predicted alpha/beta hydrolase family esterase
MRPVLTLPGIYDSGPAHWQTRWEALHPAVARVRQRDWDRPVCREWLAALDAAVARLDEAPIIVGHSLGCLLAAHWAAQSDRSVHATLLVAVPDPAGPNFPRDASGFAPIPPSLGRRRVTIVSSADDPYSSAAFTASLVHAWDAGHVALGPRGHINAESGLGDWPEGWAIVEAWRSGPRA